MVIQTNLKNFLSIFALVYFFILYICFGKNTKIGHKSLIRNYIITNGFFNNFFSKIISLFHKKKKFYKEKKLFYNLNLLDSDIETNKILDNIKKNGYFIFDKKLSKNYIEELLNFSKKINGWHYDNDGNIIEKKFN